MREKDIKIKVITVKFLEKAIALSISFYHAGSMILYSIFQILFLVGKVSENGGLVRDIHCYYNCDAM